MVIDGTRFAAQIEADLRAAGDEKRAVSEKAYLKSDLEFFGTGIFEVARQVKTVTGVTHMAREDAIALAETLWARPVFELRAAAVELLSRRATVLLPQDLERLERLIRESETWALVDGLAADVAGAIVVGYPAETEPVLDRWAADADFWVRRSALLAELKPLRAGAPFSRFARHADAMLDEGEFFIRKAIGWVLRETSKRRPNEVVTWLAPRTDRASGVTMREAVKYLPKADGERLMAAYKAKVPADPSG